MKKIFALVLFLGLIGGYLGYKMFNKPFADLQKKPADFVLAPAALLSAFTTDETQANQTYLDKTIELRGVIKSISLEDGTTRITLDAQDAMGAIICDMDQNQKPSSSALQQGQEITLRGVCSGYLMDVVLIRCIII